MSLTLWPSGIPTEKNPLLKDRLNKKASYGETHCIAAIEFAVVNKYIPTRYS
jgi:hypothetical protein